MKRIRVAVLGCGRMGKRHIEMYQRNQNVIIGGFYDSRRSLASSLASTFKARVYDDVEDPMLDSNIDAVSICTPNALHYDILRLAVKSGKDILVEKPIVTTKNHCDSLLRMLCSKAVRVMVGHTHRFYPCNLALKSILESGHIGVPKIINTFDYIPGKNPDGYVPQWLKNRKMSGGGVLMTDFVHTVDKISWLVNKPIKKVNVVFMSDFISKKNVEDVVVTNLELEDGVVATCIHGCPSPGASDMSVKIIGTKGEAAMEFAGELSVIKDSISHINYPTKGKPELHTIAAFSAEINEFINSILEDRQPTVTYRDGINAVRVILALYESFKRKSPMLVKH